LLNGGVSDQRVLLELLAVDPLDDLRLRLRRELLVASAMIVTHFLAPSVDDSVLVVHGYLGKLLLLLLRVEDGRELLLAVVT